MIPGSFTSSDGSLMNRKIRYMKTSVATTTKIDEIARWRPAASERQPMRTARRQDPRREEHDRDQLQQQVEPAHRLLCLLRQEQEREAQQRPADEEQDDLGDAAARTVPGPEHAPFEQAHRDQDQVAEDHRRGVRADDVGVGREQARPPASWIWRATPMMAPYVKVVSPRAIASAVRVALRIASCQAQTTSQAMRTRRTAPAISRNVRFAR